MRIAYYIDTMVPTKRANMVHVMKMCQAFSVLGHTVTLLCDSSTKDPDLSAIHSQYAVTDAFQIKTAYIPKLLQKYGHRIASYYGAYRKAHIPLDCDVAYSRSAASLFFIKDRIRYVYEAHMEPDAVNRLIEKQVLVHPNCEGLVVISMALKNRYLEIFPFLQPEKITVLHDAADLADGDDTTQAKLQMEGDGIRIGYIGHLYPGKCMETLIPLAKSCPQYRFHIVGGTEDWIEYWKKQAAQEAVDNLVFYGFVDNCFVGDYYRAFDMVVLPFSVNVNIGKNKRTNIGKWISPLKLFEAMAYGKPILVSRLATIEEVMTDGEDCIMAEPDNTDDWVEKLTMLCEDKALQEKIAAAAQDNLRKKYTWLERARMAVRLFE